ncbi:MAG: hypothetical protein MJ025_04645 [Victivallaceae bacterium]|nr:hypothetical protein [Victivallaceae bacterium]
MGGLGNGAVTGMVRRINRGVLLEYVILLCSILPLVFGTSFMVFELGGSDGDFGPYGVQIVNYYQRLVAVISLPVP